MRGHVGAALGYGGTRATRSKEESFRQSFIVYSFFWNRMIFASPLPHERLMHISADGTARTAAGDTT